MSPALLASHLCYSSVSMYSEEVYFLGLLKYFFDTREVEILEELFPLLQCFLFRTRSGAVDGELVAHHRLHRILLHAIEICLDIGPDLFLGGICFLDRPT